MNIVENIREIGMFIVVAQMIVHLSAGKMYEKYLKVISGVIVLLLFAKPFVGDLDSIMVRWQQEVGRMEQQMERYDSVQQNVGYAAATTEETALHKIEEEVKAMFNDAVAADGCEVTGVEIILDDMNDAAGAYAQEAYMQRSNPDWAFCSIKVTMRAIPEEIADGNTKEDAGENVKEDIHIEKISLEHDPDYEADTIESDGAHSNNGEKYTRLFAQILGVAQDKVEVAYYGGQ